MGRQRPGLSKSVRQKEKKARTEPVAKRLPDTPARSGRRAGRARVRARRGRRRLERASAELALIATVLLWSGSYTASRYAITNGFEPVAFSGLRLLVGASIFVAVVLIREGSIRLERRDLIYVVPAALLGVVVNQVAFNYALSLATAATVALLFGTLPIFASVITRMLGWEQLSRKHWIATGVSFAGVALVALGVGGQLTADLGGVLLALIAAACFALFSVLVRPLMRKHSPYRASATVIAIGTIPLAIVASPQIAGQDWAGLDLLAWAAFGYMVFMFVSTTYLWFIALDRVGAPHATLWTNLQPFIGALIAVAILSESLGALQVLGGVVIAFSIMLARWRRQPLTPGID